MLRIRVLAVLVSLLLVLVAVACRTAETEPEVDAGEREVVEELFFAFDPNNFDHSTNINNSWFPLKTGTQWVYEGTTEEDGERIPHRIEFTVTDLVKEIAGVSTVVAWIVDYADGELVEAEIAFYAQDNDGNIWYLGEYPEEYEDGEFVVAPAWIAGQEDALAGIKMMAEPRLKTPSYAQGLAPAVDWSDRGQVYEMSQQVCVPAYCYGDVLVIDEYSEDEPGAFQQKYYARNVGEVQVGWRGEDTQQEELVLVELNLLDFKLLGEARAEALALEERAYEISEVYAQTSPAESTTPSELTEIIFPEFDPANFSNSTNINNEWLPMQPGTQWVVEGFSIEDGEKIPHRIEFTVTDLTKEINGVQTVVAWIVDISEGEVVEKEIAFYAQDDDGNVWYLGEHPEEYEEGIFVAAPTWIAGVEGAYPGVKMWAEPDLALPGYFQGWAPTVDWSDYGQVDQLGVQDCVAVDCYEDVLVIAESSLDETGIYQLKFYAPGVGNMRVGWRGDAASQEELELVEHSQLDAEALAAIVAEVLALEAHAYEVSPNVYGMTPPVVGP